MKDVLLIPCWSRPEFLWHTLNNLVATGDLDTLHLVIKPDTSPHRDIQTVIDRFKDRMPSYEVRPASAARHRLTKQSQNVLQGYQYAASLTDGLVFMVEEDIQVANDFFRYHRAIHQAKPELFVSLSTKNHNLGHPETSGDPSAYYLSTGDFCSLGVCMKSSTIKELIAPHCNQAYYSNPIKYCRDTFPNSPIGPGYVEQDGLIRRVQEASGHATAYPHVPRAYHSGFYGYNRPKFTAGNLEDKVARIGSIIYDPDEMRKAAMRPEYYFDSEPINLHVESWEKVTHRQLTK